MDEQAMFAVWVRARDRVAQLRIALNDAVDTERMLRGNLAQVLNLGTTSELTARERQVYDLVMAERCDKEIATALNISTRTAKFHVGSLLKKFGVASRFELQKGLTNVSIPATVLPAATAAGE